MKYSNILLDMDYHTAWITVNRPEVYNALNFSCIKEIKDALIKCLDNDDVKAVVFNGKGGKAFIAGADINELKQKNMHDMMKSDGFQELFTFIDEYEKPTIAMIDGLALGGGCELALSCDIRIASEESKFGLPELNLSIIPAAGGTQRLAKHVGNGNALYMILTGKIISALEAKEMGLINGVATKENLYQTVKEILDNLVGKSPLALKMAKVSIKKGFNASEDVGLMLEKVSQALLFATEDKEEGMDAFIQKRKPLYQGK